jgi:hypothetical protein
MKNFWLEAYKWGGVIGVAMSAAFLVEQACLFAQRVEFMLFVVLIASVGYVVMLYYFTKRWRSQFPQEVGFPLGNAFAVLLVMIAVGAIIKGVTQYLYCNVGIGFPEYTERSIAVMEGYFARNGGVPATAEQLVTATIQQMREAPVPTFFLTLWAVIRSNLIFGTILSLILAATLKREPKPFAHVE